MPACEKIEGQKSPDGVERDEPIRDTAKKNEETTREYRQNNNPVGINEPSPAVTEGVREVVILRNGAAEAWKIGESRIGGERKHWRRIEAIVM